jgi:Bacterial PH domain
VTIGMLRHSTQSQVVSVMISSEALQQEIASGERVLWSGPPAGGIRFESESLSRSAFGLVFFGFSVFWIHGAWNQSNSSSTQSTIFALFGIPFVLIGFYNFVGHFFWSAISRKYTEYAVTTQRVIVFSGVFSRTTKSIEYRKIPTIACSEKSDGSGTIQFGEPKAVNAGEGVAYVATKIEAVPDVRTVYNIIRKASAMQA